MAVLYPSTHSNKVEEAPLPSENRDSMEEKQCTMEEKENKLKTQAIFSTKIEVCPSALSKKEEEAHLPSERRDSMEEKQCAMEEKENKRRCSLTSEHLHLATADGSAVLGEVKETRGTRNIVSGHGIHKYLKVKKIGKGSCAVVYKAKNLKTGEVVAIKNVKLQGEKGRIPFTSLREINILGSLHHPSIVELKEVILDKPKGCLFLVMELMDHDVTQAMEIRNRPFSEAETKFLMLQLLEGVLYMHDNRIIHRDLKPLNLLLNCHNKLKICDFGLSRQYERYGKPYTSSVGTFWYSAPEILLGATDYLSAIDMWSVGCIMAEMLTGEPLFLGINEISQLEQIFGILGTPDENIWPGWNNLSSAKLVTSTQMGNRHWLREKFPAPLLSGSGYDLLSKLLCYDPQKRITAKDALRHPWLKGVPIPKSMDLTPAPAPDNKDRNVRRRCF